MRNFNQRYGSLFAAAALNVADLLGKAVGSAERPKHAAAGGYQLQIVNHEFGKSSQKKTDYVQFNFRILSPEADVDMSQNAGVDFSKLKLNDKFYLTEDALYRLQDFLTQHLGLDGNGRSFQQMIAESVGATVVGQISKTPRTAKAGQEALSQDELGYFNEIVGYRNVNAAA